MKTRGPLGIIVFALVLAWGIACNDTSPEAPQHPGRQVLSDSIEVGYERLRRAYDSAETVPRAVRQMRGAMGQMHAQMHGGEGMGGGMHERGNMHGDRGMHGMHDGGQGMYGDRRAQGEQHDSMVMREWHQQMMGMHAQMAQMHDESGQGKLAMRHRQMERRHQRMMGTLPSESEQQEEPDEGPDTRMPRGDDLYVQHCASCHGPDGAGLGTAFPPLAGADWVSGDKDRAIRILIHGLQGKIRVKDRVYDSVMPAFGRRLSDREIAAILSYVRSSWGNEGEAVASDDVREMRRQYADRTEPWTVAQLREEE